MGFVVIIFVSLKTKGRTNGRAEDREQRTESREKEEGRRTL
jgi:hypothetical protein